MLWKYRDLGVQSKVSKLCHLNEHYSVTKYVVTVNTTTSNTSKIWREGQGYTRSETTITICSCVKVENAIGNQSDRLFTCLKEHDIIKI